MQLFITFRHYKFSTKSFVKQTIELTGSEKHQRGNVHGFNKANPKNFNVDFSKMDFSQDSTSFTRKKSPHFHRMKLTPVCLGFFFNIFFPKSLMIVRKSFFLGGGAYSPKIVLQYLRTKRFFQVTCFQFFLL